MLAIENVKKWVNPAPGKRDWAKLKQRLQRLHNKAKVNFRSRTGPETANAPASGTESTNPDAEQARRRKGRFVVALRILLGSDDSGSGVVDERELQHYETRSSRSAPPYEETSGPRQSQQRSGQAQTDQEESSGGNDGSANR